MFSTETSRNRAKTQANEGYEKHMARTSTSTCMGICIRAVGIFQVTFSTSSGVSEVTLLHTISRTCLLSLYEVLAALQGFNLLETVFG